jgi:hypothetical protein
MGIGVSVFLIAVGAILTFAVNATVSGIDINIVGVILMIAGLIGILVDLILFAPRRREFDTTRTVTEVPEGRYAARRRTVVRDQEVY